MHMFILHVFDFLIQVQDKYDTVHRIWKTLPTDAELYRRQSLTEEELVSEASVMSTSVH